MEKILITAGVHGNELGSIFVARELRGWIEGMGYKNVEVIPEVNLKAIEARCRENPSDDLDMNRIFPGRRDGSESEKIAYELFNHAKNYDIVIDLHTYGEDSRCVPYMLTDLNKGYNRNLCREIGLKYGVQTGGTDGQLFLELSKIGIPSMIIEAGGSNWLREDFEVVKSALMKFIEEPTIHDITFIEEYDRYQPEGEGTFEPEIHLEQFVKKGEIIGYLDGYPVETPWNGIILGHKTGGDYDHEEMSLASIGFVNK